MADDPFAEHAAMMESMNAPGLGAIIPGRSRDALLRAAFTDEALRRMARKASVESAAQKGALQVNDELRSIAEVMLGNVCAKAQIIAGYRDSQSITTSVLRAALEILDVKIDVCHEPSDDGTFQACKSLRKKTGGKGAKKGRGTLAAKEIKHEARNEDCVYTQRAPFIRLLKNIIANSAIRVSPEAVSWIQFIIEALLIDLLHKTGFVVEEITKGHTEDTARKPAKAKRNMINARDLKACVEIYKNCWLILAGRRRPLLPAEKGRRGGVSRIREPSAGGGRGRGGEEGRAAEGGSRGRGVRAASRARERGGGRATGREGGGRGSRGRAGRARGKRGPRGPAEGSRASDGRVYVEVGGR